MRSPDGRVDVGLGEVTSCSFRRKSVSLGSLMFRQTIRFHTMAPSEATVQDSISSRMRVARASIANGFVMTCIPGSR
jgi:hypothetical protein